MRKRDISLTLVTQVASIALLIGCSEDHRAEVQRCTDNNGFIVPDEKCEQVQAVTQPATTTTTRPGGGHVTVVNTPSPYRWYYGGSGMHVGESASGGSFTPNPSNQFVARPNASGGGMIIDRNSGAAVARGTGSSISVPRGGFGSSGRSFGGGSFGAGG